ncbi:hypothetical protein [Azomonas macrocytogenes]|uniref:Uncharacterized protein n=1 Tax=Azomonas macrocytogenes TaxID=69962 RepID=A0A839T6W4_AZOMA|nr:hypothetical protein [Azomonas macrocytogenes]MBB3105247.1 hypothetical protein [Azomonas macrocytogenes]
MMTLTTTPQLLSPDTVRVFWDVGLKRNGILDLTLGLNTQESELVAELCAMRYLLLERQVFNRKPSSGKGIKLRVSTGAIRKLMLGKSTKREALPYAQFLGSCMAGAEFEVQRNMDFKASADDPQANIESLYIDPAVYGTPHLAFDTPAIGQIFVTVHAVQQYVERNISGELTRPLSSLVRRLQHPGLCLRPIPEKVLRHKAHKYGSSSNIEAWGHTTSCFTYLFLVDGAKRTLVTVFRRMG